VPPSLALMLPGAPGPGPLDAAVYIPSVPVVLFNMLFTTCEEPGRPGALLQPPSRSSHSLLGFFSNAALVRGASWIGCCCCSIYSPVFWSVGCCSVLLMLVLSAACCCCCWSPPSTSGEPVIVAKFGVGVLSRDSAPLLFRLFNVLIVDGVPAAPSLPYLSSSSR